MALGETLSGSGKNPSSQPSGNVLGSKTHEHEMGKIQDDEQLVQVFAKQMLQGRLFIATYQARRYVDLLQSYRDVVAINPSEMDLKKDLDIVRKRLQEFYGSKTWIGITGPSFDGMPAGHCLWTKFQDLPFGTYWFQIKNVKFIGNFEMIVRLKCVRVLQPGDILQNHAVTESKNSTVQEQNCQIVSSQSGQQFTIPDWSEFKDISKDFLYNTLIPTLYKNVSFKNMKEVLVFTAVFVVACAAGMVEFIKHLGDFTIKFMREASLFIQSSTPLWLGILDIFSKIVGGFLMCFAMVWRSIMFKQPPRYPAQDHPQYRGLPSPQHTTRQPTSPLYKRNFRGGYH